MDVTEKMEINDPALKGRAAFCYRVSLPLHQGEATWEARRDLERGLASPRAQGIKRQRANTLALARSPRRRPDEE